MNVVVCVRSRDGAVKRPPNIFLIPDDNGEIAEHISTLPLLWHTGVIAEHIPIPCLYYDTGVIAEHIPIPSLYYGTLV